MKTPVSSCNRCVVITGGSDGIGRCLVTCYAQMGWRVVAIGRRRLESISPPMESSVQYVEQDLTEADSVESLLKVLHNLPVSLLILNAGMGMYGDPATHSPDDIKQLINLNFIAPLELSRQLHGKLKSNQGSVIFIGSTAYRGAHDKFAVYVASKRALDGAAKNLRLEWQNRINVQTVHPCPTATEMHNKVGMPPAFYQKLFVKPEDMAYAISKFVDSGRSFKTFGVSFMIRNALRRELNRIFVKIVNPSTGS